MSVFGQVAAEAFPQAKDLLPFEFTVKGPPVSHQTANRSRLQAWKRRVREAASAVWRHPDPPSSRAVTFSMTYFHEGSSPDVDNLIKPVQDALEGLVYLDDGQVVDTRSRRKSLDGSYRIRGASPVLLLAFAEGHEFLHIRVEENRSSPEPV